jgi:DNA-binding NarL/FixJ family response regulator
MAIKPRFIVVDDHPLYRHGVNDLVTQELRLDCVGEAGTVAEALELIERHRPELAVVDISLQGQNGLDLVKSIKASYPGTAVLVLSMHEDGLYGERALKAGARGYVMKHESPHLLLSSIKEVLEGRIAVREELRERMIEGLVGNKGKADPVDTLSDRELDVFRRIGKGFGASEIAQTLGISVKTVNAYRDHLKEKLNLQNAAELRKYAVEWISRSRETV